MKKTKTYRSGTTTCRTYLKTAGNGFEVGFVFAGKTTFVGNFVHSSEATTWYNIMNREIRQFSKKYKVGPKCSKTWYGRFVTAHLNNRYCGYVERLFTRHTSTAKKAFNRDERKYTQMKRRWTGTGTTRTAFLKAA